MFRTLLATAVACALAANAAADDWPQWMGPHRDGDYAEEGVVDRIPEDGLPIKWRVPIAGGYGGPSVVGDRVYVMDYVVSEGTPRNDPGARVELKGTERVHCLDAGSGETVWKHEYASPYDVSYPTGPRCTPTVADGVVYTLGTQGDLMALAADTGDVKWQVNLADDLGAPVPQWGFAGHPLVVGDVVVTMVGGDGQGVVAFGKADGKVRWKALSSSGAGYAPPVLTDAGGETQLIAFVPGQVAGLDPADGSVYWTVPFKVDYEMSVAAPVRDGDRLFVAGYRAKSKMLRLGADAPTAEVLWEGDNRNSLSTGTSGPVFHDGVVYGSDAVTGQFTAVHAENGDKLWETFEPVRPEEERRLNHGTAFVTRHAPSGRYLIFGETGLLTLADLDRDGYTGLGQMQVVEPTADAFGRLVVWSHPAYAGRTAYVRNDKEIVAVDLSAR